MEETFDYNFVNDLNALMLGNEEGWVRGGFYGSDELEAMTRRYSHPRVLRPLVHLLREYASLLNTHEILHCFDVGKGAAELAEKLQEFNTGKDHFNSVHPYFPQNPEDAFLAGVFHDIALAFTPEMFTDPALRLGLAELVKDEAQKRVFTDGVLYNKGPVEDDVFGAALLGRVGLGTRTDLRTAVISALSAEEQQGLAVPAKPISMLHKVLDGIWYHDGNNPVRGFAEAYMLVGDRLGLYGTGQVDARVIGQGLKKLLTYTASEEGRPADDWKLRGRSTDIFYLERMVEKKAPGFIAAVKDTPVYDFIVDDLACRRRGERTLQSQAFRRAVDEMPKLLKTLEGKHELKKVFTQQIDELYRRHAVVQERYLR